MQRFGLVCLRCGKQEPFAVKGRCACGGTMLVDYDLDFVAKSMKIIFVQAGFLHVEISRTAAPELLGFDSFSWGRLYAANSDAFPGG